MSLIAVSGHPGCRYEEVARITAQRLGLELLTQSRIRLLTDDEFGAETPIPDKAYPSLVTSILARLATENHLVYCAVGGEVQSRHFLGMLRVHVVAPENVRVGNLMLDSRMERPAARQLLLQLAPGRAPAPAATGVGGPGRPQSQVWEDPRHRRSLRPGAERRIAHLRADGRADRDRGGL